MEKLNNQPLLVFAHQKEAQPFIKSGFVSKAGENYFIGDYYQLFITGGGREKTFLQLASLLGKLHANKNNNLLPSKIINLGVVARLGKNITSTEQEIGKIIKIRTCYGFYDNIPQFKSYELIRNIPNLRYGDCISVSGRIQSSSVIDELEKMFPQAKVIDQELWPICYIAAHYNIPVLAWKIVSDSAHQISVSEKKLIKDIRENEKIYHQLHQTFINDILKTPQTPKHISYPWEIKNDFHFTLNQKFIITQWVKHLEFKYPTSQQLLSFIDWPYLQELFTKKNYTPKQKTKILINQFKKVTNNFSLNFKDKINQLIKLLPADIAINYDPQLEDINLNINFKADSLINYENKITILNNSQNKKLLSDIFTLYSGEKELN